MSGHHDSRTWPISVRVARPEDKPSVLSFATTTWNGWDYIPDVWDDWLVAPSDGVLLVATVGKALSGEEPLDAEGALLAVGEPIAMTRLVMLSADEAWLEGIRVDPRVRGLDVATDLQVAELRWAAAHGARVIRYLTSESNIGSQRLGARHGLLEIGRWRSYGRPAEGAQPSTRSREEIESTLAMLGHGRVIGWSQLKDDPMLQAAHGLYEYRPWAFQELTQERFGRHVARNEVLTAGHGGRSATAIVNRRRIEVGIAHVASTWGDPELLLELLNGLGRPEVRLPDAPLPALSGLYGQLDVHGYTPWHQASVIVERPMDPAHPPPQPLDSRLLMYADEPRRIAVPRSLEGYE